MRALPPIEASASSVTRPSVENQMLFESELAW